MALYDDYKSKLASPAGYGGTDNVTASLERDLVGANVDAGLATSRMQKSDEASNARSAFAAGKASGQKKVFKGKSSGAYGAIGRLDSANMEAAGKAQKQAGELNLLSPRAQAERNAALAQAKASTTASLSAQRQSIMSGSRMLEPIRLW